MIIFYFVVIIALLEHIFKEKVNNSTEVKKREDFIDEKTSEAKRESLNKNKSN